MSSARCRWSVLVILLVVASGCAGRDDADDSAQALLVGAESDLPDASPDADDDCFDEWCWDEPWDPDEEPQPIDASVPDAAEDAATEDAADADASPCTAQPEPTCPAAPPGFLPQNPGIPSRAQCRGACGADCPATCRAITSPTVCLEWQTADCGWHAKVCTYPARECGSHAGCRVHDTCYDACATSRFPRTCRRSCDLACVRINGARRCRSWMNGNGPYDSWLQYAGAPTSSTYDSTCY